LSNHLDELSGAKTEGAEDKTLAALAEGRNSGADAIVLL